MILWKENVINQTIILVEESKNKTKENPKRNRRCSWRTEMELQYVVTFMSHGDKSFKKN